MDVGGGGTAAYITASRGGGGHERGQWEWGRRGRVGQTPWRQPRGGGGCNKHPEGISRGGGQDGTNTLVASPGGGGEEDATNTLVQPHYPTPTQSVNPAGARGGG